MHKAPELWYGAPPASRLEGSTLGPSREPCRLHHCPYGDGGGSWGAAMTPGEWYGDGVKAQHLSAVVCVLSCFGL